MDRAKGLGVVPCRGTIEEKEGKEKEGEEARGRGKDEGSRL